MTAFNIYFTKVKEMHKSVFEMLNPLFAAFQMLTDITQTKAEKPADDFNSDKKEHPAPLSFSCCQ